MGCLGNSKTTEDQGVDEKERREANKKIEKQLQKERLAYKATHRLLLLGKAGGRAPARGRSPAQRQELGQRARRAAPGRVPRDCGHLLQPSAGMRLKMPALGYNNCSVWFSVRGGKGIGLQITAFFLFVCRGW